MFQELLIASWLVLTKLAPWFLIGAAIAGLLHGLLPAGFVRQRLQGAWGVVKAVLLGVPLPLCSCGVVPAGIGLRRDGASRGAAVAFLISTPQTGVDSILVSASFLGWPFAIFKVFAAAITGLVGGWLTNLVVPESPTDNVEGALAETPRASRSWRDMLNHSLEIVDSIRYWLVIGVVASAAIGTLVPHQWLASIEGVGTAGASLLALAIAVPLYVCATASVPIGAALVAAGFPTGATLVFLMAGPATNLATMGAIYREFGRKTLAVYLLTIVVGSILLAHVFDWLIAPDKIPELAIHGHQHAGWIAQISAGVLLAVLLRFFFRDLRKKLGRSSIQDAGPNEVRTIGVDGMHCQACVSRLEKSLQQTPGVEAVEVHLTPGEAIVRGTADQESLRRAVESAGFVPVDGQREAGGQEASV